MALIHASCINIFALPPKGILRFVQFWKNANVIWLKGDNPNKKQVFFCVSTGKPQWLLRLHVTKRTFSTVTINLRGALLLQDNTMWKERFGFSQWDSPRSFHPRFSGRRRKLSTKLSACVSPVSSLLPQSPNTEVVKKKRSEWFKIRAQAEEMSLQCGRADIQK